jgi:hypothetical protein
MLVVRHRSWIGLAALAVAASFGPGCDTKQPTDASGAQGNAAVVFSAPADVDIYDVYDFFVDANHCADNCTGDIDCTQSLQHRCVNNVCVVPCTQTTDCLFGQTCNVATSTCYPVSSTACTLPGNTCSGSTTCVLDQDGIADDVSFDGVPDTFSVCARTFTQRNTDVPINYWVDIKKIPAGSSTPVQISDPALANSPIANTGFSTNPIETGVSPARPFWDTDPTHFYTNPRRMDASRPELMALPALVEGTFGVPFIGIQAGNGNGNPAYCPFGVTFPPPPTFTTDMQEGDTLTVTARKLNPLTVTFGPVEPPLTARVLVNGVLQVPTGTTSAAAPGSSLSFTFTVR